MTEALDSGAKFKERPKKKKKKSVIKVNNIFRQFFKIKINAKIHYEKSIKILNKYSAMLSHTGASGKRKNVAPIYMFYVFLNS